MSLRTGEKRSGLQRRTAAGKTERFLRNAAGEMRKRTLWLALRAGFGIEIPMAELREFTHIRATPLPLHGASGSILPRRTGGFPEPEIV